MAREHIAVEYGRKWLICRAKVGEIVPTYTVVCETSSGALAGSTLAALTSAPDRQHKTHKAVGKKGTGKLKSMRPMRTKQTRATREPARQRGMQVPKPVQIIGIASQQPYEE